MKFEFTQVNLSKSVNPIVFCFENKYPSELKNDEQVKELLSSKEFTGKLGDLATIGFGSQKLVLAGLGKEKEASFDKLVKVFGNAIKVNRGKKATSVFFPKTFLGEQAIGEAIAQGALLATYSFQKYKNDSKPIALDKIIIFSTSSSLKKGVEEGEKTSELVNYCRDLDNEPSNVATPEYVAKECKKIAGNGLKTRVFDKKQLKKMNAGGILSVGSGSSHPPRLVIMEWNGGGKEKPIALVGKGITFDSGGISIKPGSKMDEMKFDKSGACAVIAAMKACKELKIRKNVVGVCALAENVPSGTSYKPGDVLKTFGGKTIEVLNTDAEGRILLADAVEYAKKIGASKIIDLATLTGACVTALGSEFTGLFSNNDELKKEFLQSAKKAGEKMWELPLDPEYFERMKGVVADVQNLSKVEGEAGASTGAEFIHFFVGDTPWIHLDIAGTAWTKRPAFYESGSTGVCVRSLIEFLKN